MQVAKRAPRRPLRRRLTCMEAPGGKIVASATSSGQLSTTTQGGVMTDQDQRVERNDERVEDLEVRGDEAREIAGGKKANRMRKRKAAGQAQGISTSPGKKAT